MMMIMAQSSQSAENTIITHSPTMVEKVLTLPLQPAARTLPPVAATIRRPETANSRASTIMTAQAGILPH
jgi:hypothetical protein